MPKGATGERGDLYVVIKVQVPPKITDEERVIWENLARVSRYNPRDSNTDE